MIQNTPNLPCCNESLVILHSSDSLLQIIHDHFEVYSRCLLIAQLEKCGKEWKEVSRGFIVGVQWPFDKLPHPGIGLEKRF